MKIHILGCNGPYPAPGNATSGYLIEYDGKKLLLDCGAGILGKLMEKISPSELSAVILSHLHSDHMSDMPVLGYYYELHGERKTVFVPPEEMSGRREQLDSRVFDVRDMTDRFVLDGAAILTMPVAHPVPCRAIRIEAEGKVFVFTGDTNCCEGLADFCRGAYLLMADSAFSAEQWGPTKPHLSAALCGRLAAEAKAGRLLLTHLRPENDAGALCTEASAYFEQVFAAEPGMTVEV